MEYVRSMVSFLCTSEQLKHYPDASTAFLMQLNQIKVINPKYKKIIIFPSALPQFMTTQTEFLKMMMNTVPGQKGDKGDPGTDADPCKKPKPIPPIGGCGGC